jgi:hypothetical protein
VKGDYYVQKVDLFNFFYFGIKLGG